MPHLDYAKFDAIELQQEIERAQGKLLSALKEIDRLRTICQDIVELVNTDHRLIIEPTDPWAVLNEINDVADCYFVSEDTDDRSAA